MFSGITGRGQERARLRKDGRVAPELGDVQREVEELCVREPARRVAVFESWCSVHLS